MSESKPHEEKEPAEGGEPSHRLEGAIDPVAGATSKGDETNGKDDETNGGAATDESAQADDENEEKRGGEHKNDEKERERDLLPRGNPLRLARGLATMAAGGIPAFALVAKNGQNAWAVPLGALFVVVVAVGVMDLLGTFDDRDATVGARTTLRDLGGPLLRTLGTATAFAGSLAAAQTALLPWWGSSIAVTGTFLGLVACLFELGRELGPWRTDELGAERPLLRRHGFWVVAIGAILYFPALGLFSLWDPWETHYGEVAREVLARDDWISLWWAQDGWFWSKPILNFWIQALSMATLGTHYHPDQMLIAANGTASAHPEWAVRAPNVLMTIGAMYLLYKGVAKVFGRRAGLLGALVLATMPDWFFLAHQTMTDMPFVASMTAAMGLLLTGLNTPEEERVTVYELEIDTRLLGTIGVALAGVLVVLSVLPSQAGGGRMLLLGIAVVVAGLGFWGRVKNARVPVRLSLFHLVFGAILVIALPQILYLLSRNIELVVFGDGPKGFRIHWDEFHRGSAGNCGLPGNEKCMTDVPASIPKGTPSRPDGGTVALVRYFGGVEPSLQAIVWAGVLGGVLYMNWGERRARRLVYIAAWLCAAVATMAKGPAGFGLPIICAFAYVATKRRWSELLRFEMMTGLLVIAAVAVPWYVAMYVRHGSPFTDRLIFHDMFNRAFSHVHDTNEGDDTGIRYYLWQLGYALFPWTGLAPLGLSWWLRKSDSADTHASAARGIGGTGLTGDASVMLFMWFLFAFGLFTFMGTKFHHYIFPAVPPVAMLIGVALDDTLGEVRLAKPGKLWAYLGGLALSLAIVVWGFSKLWPGSPFGTKSDASSVGTTGVAVSLCIAAMGIALLVAIVLMFRDTTAGADEATPEHKVVADPHASPFRGGVAVSGDSPEETRRRGHEALMIGAAALAGALVLVLVGRDLVSKPTGADQPGAIRLLHLFTYNYRRPWPDTLDFRAILGGFTIAAVLLAGALAVRSIRKHAVAAFCAFAFVWALWGTDVYMVVMSPHWGQHEVMEAYYRDRKDGGEQLIAYQMNWKGENFYTGNKIPAFVSSGANFQNWLKGQKEQGARVMYFVTEHGRIGSLRSEVGAKSYKEVTDKALCNKFVLVRAEL